MQEVKVSLTGTAVALVLGMDIPIKHSKRKRIVRRILYITVGLIFIALVSLGLSRLEPASPSVDRRTLYTGVVKRGSMLRQVRGVGNLVSEDVLVVPAAVSGRVVEIFVEPGTIVDANTEILRLVNPELQLQWLDAQSRLNSANAQLAARKTQLQDQSLSMDAEQARMEADIREAKLMLEVDQKQYEDELISELNLSLSKARVEELEKLSEISKKRLAMFRDQTCPAQLAEFEAAVQQAESQFNLRQSQIDSLRVRAGTSGVLASVREKIELGQSVSAGTILARITNPKRLKAQLRIPEAQARDVVIGLSAEVDTYNGTVVGTVSRIDPTVMEGNVTVDIKLNGELPEGARPDLSVIGTIEIERLNDIIYVNRPAFASSQSTVELFKLVEEGKYAVRTRVKLGRSSVNTIEILEGLVPEDEVILVDMSQWDEHDKIRLK
ncbi:MAG: HlyD family efflux transporter periplasmic adaptor subunit [Sedimentisphaerales bacterium]|nr:HlyD family efflux transporter periplasmic adaptor subunit [Sedimentisphaerales bacterium]